MGQKGVKKGSKWVFFHFLEFWSIDFLYFAYYDRWAWCLATSVNKLPKKKCRPPIRGQKGVKRGQNEVFVHFLEFAPLVFANFAYYDRWSWCLATSVTKSPEKKCAGPKSGQTGPHEKSVGIRREYNIFAENIIPKKKKFFCFFLRIESFWLEKCKNKILTRFFPIMRSRHLRLRIFFKIFKIFDFFFRFFFRID